MKFYFLCFVLFVFAARAQSQITNGQVNYELYVDQVQQTCDNDGVTNDDNEVRIGLSSDTNTGGTATWTSGGDGASCGGNLYVFRWQADAPSTITRTNRLLYRATNRNNVANSFAVYHDSWEEDGSADCDPSGDACRSSGTWTMNFRGGTRTPNRFWGYAGSADIANWVTGQSGNFSAKTVWRFTNGNACTNALQFGTLTSGTTYSHVNSNRVTPAGASADLGYTNVSGNSSPDVFYQFTLAAAATVTISTDNATRNFDTYIRLYNSSTCGTQIAFNDDFGGSVGSTITQDLCAGTYTVQVEGFSAGTGDFELTVRAVHKPANGGTLTGGTSPVCAGTDPGVLTSAVDASGIGTLTYQWEQSTVSNSTGFTPIAGATSSTYDMPPLTQTTWFRRRVTDACGNSAISGFRQIVVNTPPPNITINGVAPTAGYTFTTCAVPYVMTANCSNCSGAQTYQWAGSSGIGGTSASTTMTSTGGAGGSLTVTENGCATTFTNFVVAVNTPSTAPTAITGTATICSGGNTVLSVSGGSLGTGASFAWYSSSCGGTLVGTGNSVTVSPTSNTTYFVRAQGSCNTTTCASATVTVNTPSTAPTAITGTTTICAFTPTVLTASGGTAGTGANFEWFIGSCGGTSAGTGASITVSPSSTTTYFVRRVGTCNTTACISRTVTVNTTSGAPTSMSASQSFICPGESSVLTVNGGALGTGANYVWYTTACGSGAAIGTGASITVSPVSTTGYFVRIEGTCNTTTCASGTIFVRTPSVAPTTITGTLSTCGGFTTLTASGGTMGDGASYVWFTGSCGGTQIATSSSISVNPSTTTSYFVRYQGICNTTTCASATVTVNTPSTAPTAITGTATICSGGNTVLSVSGGSLGTGASFAWYSGSCGGTLVGTGNSVTVSPTSNTTYFVRAQGSCNTTTCASATVTVNTPSTAPSIAAAPAINCPNTTLVLNASGGTSGTGAVIRWYSGANGSGTLLGSGSNLTITPASTTTYYARREDGCTTTSDASTTVNVRDFVYAANNTSANNYCTDASGWHHFYTGSQIILSLQGDLSGVSSMTATIRTNPSYYQDRPSGASPFSCSNNWSPGEERFEMPRNWNISYTGTLNGSYNVRYYYPMAERTSVETAAQNWIATYPDCGYTYKRNPTGNGWFWFKNTTGTYTAPLFEDLILTAGGNGSVGSTNYSTISGISSFSGGSGAVILVPAASLPVELLSFTGTYQAPNVKLQWATASEQNNSHFDIERSANGIDFERIGRLQGQGNAQTETRYDFIDAAPAVGINYYRLRQEDTDGSAELSHIVAVNVALHSDNAFTFYPNPTIDGQIRYRFESRSADMVEIEIFNALGQVVARQEQPHQNGVQEIAIDMSQLPPAAYMLRARHKATQTTNSATIIRVAP